MDAISDEMRAVVEELWPELTHELNGRRDKKNVRFPESPVASNQSSEVPSIGEKLEMAANHKA